MPSGIKLNKIEDLKRSMLNCNVFSVYDYDCLSMQELLCTFFEKINQCVDVTNKTVVLVDWLVSQGLKEEVAKKLESWFADGTLANIINEVIFKELNNKVLLNTRNINNLENNFTEYKNTNDARVNKIRHELDSVFVFSDSYPTLQQAHDEVVRRGGGTLVINKDYDLVTSLLWDIRKVIINGGGHTIRFNLNNKNDYGLKTVSSETLTHPFHQATNNISELKMYFNRGNGILLSGETSAKACSHITFNRCTISDTNNALKFGSNAYLVQFRDCDIYDSNNLLEILENVTNSGENINFVGCVLYNSYKGITAKNGNCDLFFTNCSFDYFERGNIFDVDNSKVFLDNCHIEFDLSKLGDSYPIKCVGDSGVISINNSLIMGTNLSNTKVESIFYTQGEQARINLSKCFLYGLRTTSKWLCGGSGRLYTDRNILNTVPECDLKINPNTTQSVSGSMLVDKITDAILTEDTGDKSSLTGNNIQVSLVNDGHNYKYNTNIKINKSAGAGQVGAVMFYAPIQQGSTNNIATVIKRVSGSGDINITYGYCTVNGNETAQDRKGEETVNLSGDWSHKEYFMKNAPMWATHMYINIATSSATSSDIRIGEICANSF